MKKTNFKAILKTMAVVAFLSGCNLAANNANFSNDQTSLEHEAEIYNQNSAIVIQLPGGSNPTERATYSFSEVNSYKVSLIYGGKTLKTQTGKPGDKVTFEITEDGSYTIKVQALRYETIIAEGETTTTVNLAQGNANVKIKLKLKNKPVNLNIQIETDSTDKTPPAEVTWVENGIKYTIYSTIRDSKRYSHKTIDVNFRAPPDSDFDRIEATITDITANQSVTINMKSNEYYDANGNVTATPDFYTGYDLTYRWTSVYTGAGDNYYKIECRNVTSKHKYKVTIKTIDKSGNKSSGKTTPEVTVTD